MISLNNSTISTTAAVGAVVGTLALMDASRAAMDASFELSKACAGFFVVSGSDIETVATPIPPGNYSVSVHGVGSSTWWQDRATFQITVTP